MLCETIPVKTGTCVIIGIGVNGNVGADELLGIDQPATSLQELIGRPVDMEEQLKRLTKEIKHLIQTLPLWGRE